MANYVLKCSVETKVRHQKENTARGYCVVFLDLCNRVSASVPVNGLPADRCLPEQRFSGGWVVVQQQEGPHIPAGQAKLSHACRLQRSGRQTGWGTSQGRDVRGGHVPRRHCFCSTAVFVWMILGYCFYLSLCFCTGQNEAGTLCLHVKLLVPWWQWHLSC